MNETRKSSHIGQGRRRLRLLVFALIMLAAIGMPIKAKAATEYTEVKKDNSTFGFNVNTQAKTAKLMEYKYSGTISAGSAFTLTIPSEFSYKGETYTVTELYINCLGTKTTVTDAIERVDIPKTVETINFSAFKGLTKLKTVTIPEGSALTYIGSGAFQGCTGLSSINIQKATSLTTIGGDAFRDCDGLTGFQMGNTKVQWIYEGAFRGCDKLETVHLPSTIKGIGKSAFQDAAKLRIVYTTIGTNQLTSIGESAFMGTALKDITIPSGCTTIGKSAFENCTALYSVTLPDTLTSLGSYAFKGCTALTGIAIPQNVTTINWSCFEGSGLTTVTIPKQITQIGSRAFQNCTKLTTLKFEAESSKLKEISSYAFAGCNNLKMGDGGEVKIRIPATVQTLGESAFSGCNSMETFEMEPTQSKLGALPKKAFYGCTNLKNVTLGACIRSIGDSCFEGCSFKLTSIKLPYGLENMGQDVFASCSQLGEIIYARPLADYRALFAGSPQYEAKVRCVQPAKNADISVIRSGNLVYSFEDADKVSVVSYAPGFTGDQAIPGKLSVNNIDVFVIGIAKAAFRYNESLTAVTIPDSVTQIGTFAFGDCSKLKTVRFPATDMDIIVSTAFMGTPWYASQPDGPFVVGRTIYGYKGATGSTLYLPNMEGVTRIGAKAFYNSDSIKEVFIPETITEICGQAFEKCTNLERFEMSDSVKTIRKNAFSETKLADGVVYYKGSRDSFDALIESMTGEADRQAFTNATKVFETYVTEQIDADSVRITEYRYRNSAGTIKGLKNNRTLTIPSELNGCKVTAIGENAFEVESRDAENSYKNPIRIEIPDTVKEIGKEAFSGNQVLQTVALPDSMGSFGEGVFSGCTALTEIDLPSGIETISQDMFFGCKKLRRVSIPDSVTKIEYAACSEDKEITNLSTWRVIKAKGHDFGTNNKTCSVCGEENPYYSEELEEDPSGDDPGSGGSGGTGTGTGTGSGTGSGTGTGTGSGSGSGTTQPGGGEKEDVKTAPDGATLVGGEYIAKKQTNTKITKAKAAKKSVKLTLKKVASVKGYQIQYATDSKFKKDKKTYLVKKNKTVSVTIKKLKSKKKYYFRVRSYKEEKFNGKTVKIYSKWSGTKKVTVK